MTSTGSQSRAFVWDSSALVSAGRAQRMDVLGDLVKGSDPGWAHCVPATVAAELGQLGVSAPDWAKVVHVDGLDEIVAFAQWAQRFVVGPRSPAR